MSVFSDCQVVAFLFKRNGVVDVAVENPPRIDCFELANSDSGASTLESKLVPLRNMAEPPFFCICTAPDAHFGGMLFEELQAAPIRRLLLAQPKLVSFAARHDASADSAETLLRAYREQFPKASHAA